MPIRVNKMCKLCINRLKSLCINPLLKDAKDLQTIGLDTKFYFKCPLLDNGTFYLHISMVLREEQWTQKPARLKKTADHLSRVRLWGLETVEEHYVIMTDIFNIGHMS